MKQQKVSLDDADLEALEEICREEGGSISGLIRKTVKFWLKARKEAKA